MTYYKVSRSEYDNFEINEISNVIGDTESMIVLSNGRKEKKNTNGEIIVSSKEEAVLTQKAFAQNHIQNMEKRICKDTETIARMRQIVLATEIVKIHQ